MNFRFDVKLTEQDYLEFNKFHMLRSPYGRKQVVTFRTAIGVVCALLVVLSLVANGLSLDFLLGCIPTAIVFVLFQLGLNRFLVFSLKQTMKNIKKSGKMAYSPESVMEFGEDSFSEITSETRVEQAYRSIERISVVDGKMIYIHINAVMAFLLPVASFSSEEQYREFLDMICKKCDNVAFY